MTTVIKKAERYVPSCYGAIETQPGNYLERDCLLEDAGRKESSTKSSAELPISNEDLL